MVVTTITNHEFGKMVQAAAAKLTAQADYINSLNVFPVPDGDTGTNMSMSMASGAKYERDATATAVGDLANALAKGLLMGARGNSLPRAVKGPKASTLRPSWMPTLTGQRRRTRPS